MLHYVQPFLGVYFPKYLPDSLKKKEYEFVPSFNWSKKAWQPSENLTGWKLAAYRIFLMPLPLVFSFLGDIFLHYPYQLIGKNAYTYYKNICIERAISIIKKDTQNLMRKTLTISGISTASLATLGTSLYFGLPYIKSLFGR